MRSTECDHRDIRVTATLTRSLNTNRGVRIKQVACLVKDQLHRFNRGLFIDRKTVKQFTSLCQFVFVERDNIITGIHFRHQASKLGTVTVVQVEQQTFKVTGHRDIHRRCDRMLQRTNFVLVLAHQAVQYIIVVGSNDQLLDRQAHLTRHVTRENITEVTGRYRVRHRTQRTTQIEA